MYHGQKFALARPGSTPNLRTFGLARAVRLMGMVRARVLAVGLCFAAVDFGIGCGDAKADWQWRVAVQMHEGAAHRRTDLYLSAFFCFDRFRRAPFGTLLWG
jgi:hypothetical protein